MNTQLPPFAHTAGQGPVPLSNILSDRIGDLPVTDDHVALPPMNDVMARAIMTLDTVSAEEKPPPVKSSRSTRREEILDGASQLFAEYGYYGASLRDISRRVGISHPGMLHHFSSKDVLLGAVIDRLEAHAQRVLDHIDDMCSDHEALLKAMADSYNPASHPIQLLASLDAESVSKDHPGRFRMARLRRVHEHVLEHSFVKFAERGTLRDGIEPAFAGRALMALVLGHAVREKTVRTMQRDNHEDSPVKDLGKLADCFLLRS